MKRVNKDFWQYISLSILGMLGSSGTILADTFFVSNRLGTTGLAALNIAIAVFGLINGMGMMFGIGGATRYSVLKVQKQHSAANRAFMHALWAALAVGLCFFLAGLFCTPWIAQSLGATEEILPLCETYLKTVLCFSPFLF